MCKKKKRQSGGRGGKPKRSGIVVDASTDFSSIKASTVESSPSKIMVTISLPDTCSSEPGRSSAEKAVAPALDEMARREATADDDDSTVAAMTRDGGEGRSTKPLVTIRLSDQNKGAQGAAGEVLHADRDLTFATVEEFIDKYVEDPSKRRPIKRILVATNGIAAVRCMLSLRKLLVQLFRDDKVIKFICLTTEHEILSNAEYLKMADFIVFSPGGDNRNNYANVDEIVQHAVENKVDAVWAGWGHASENPELPRQLSQHGIVFIGPPASAMFALGDKIASTIIAQTLEIPTIEWSGSGLRLDLPKNVKPEDVVVGDEIFHKACVSDLHEGLRALETHKITYPMMIKASEGGGGKGIRKCQNEADFKENFVHVQTEVPGSPIFLMKCVENARHIEVQLIADRYGMVIPVFTRDCSIQRRCQKIIEEAPASIAPKEVLRRMQEDAVKIAKLVGYESAGTVEYMYLPAENRYFFLELNPRLQVEHPCTEMLANINIPATQLQIAMGLPLHRVVDIRLFYGLNRYDTTPLPKDLVLTDTEYSVIAARITSEDPEDFFRPSTGSVEVLNFRSAQNVWGYFSVASAGKVHEYADSQFGHLFARGRTRHEAISVLLCALQELELRASFASQVSYLADLLKEKDFTENRFNTQWLDERIANKVCAKAPLPVPTMIAISSGVVGFNRVKNAFNNFRNAIERGQILPTKDLTETFLFDLVKDMKIYKVRVTRCGPLAFVVEMNGSKTNLEIRQLGDGSLLVTHKERSYTCHLEETADKFKVTIGRSLVVFEKDNDPTILKSPYTGRLLQYKTNNREWVKIGAVYASIESMKLVFNVEVKKAPGRLEHVAKEGDLLWPGSVIARLVDQKDQDMYRPQPFNEIFPEWQENSESAKDIPEPKRFNAIYDKCVNVLHGSTIPGSENKPEELVRELFEYLESATLPDALLKSVLTPVLPRVPHGVSQALKDAQYKLTEDKFEKFRKIKAILDKYLGALSSSEWETAKTVCNSLYNTCEQFEGGPFSHTCFVLNSLLREYRECEEYFEGRQYDDTVSLLNEHFTTEKDAVVRMIYSHTQLKTKNAFLLKLLEAVEQRGMHLVAPLAENLRSIGNMFHTGDVCNRSRSLLLQNNRIKYRKFLNKIIWDLRLVPLDQRDSRDVLRVDEAVDQLKQLLATMVDDGTTPKSAFEKSPWLHKVIHEFFFDSRLSDFAIRAYIGSQFAIENEKVTQSRVDKVAATIYDFNIDENNIVRFLLSPGSDGFQYLSLIKSEVSFDEFLHSIDNEGLLDTLAERYRKNGLRSNGIRATLRVTFLVNALPRPSSSENIMKDREALLEELPEHSEEDDRLVIRAEHVARTIRTTLKDRLELHDVLSNVLLVKSNAPLLQLDFLVAEKLELWRLPSEAQLVSDRLSSLHVFKYDDPDKRFSRLFSRQLLEIPIRNSKNFEDEVEHYVAAELDSACGAINVTMSKKENQRQTFVSNHVLLHVTFPKLDVNFTANNLDALDDVFETAIRLQKDILQKHHVTEVELVYVYTWNNGLVKRRVKLLDETGVTPEFGIYDEYRNELQPQRLSHQLYGSTLEEHGRIRKIEKKRAQTRTSGTTYVYDLPSLFGRACLEKWRKLEESSEVEERSPFEKQFGLLSEGQQQAYHNGDYRCFYKEEELVLKSGELTLLSDRETLKRRANNCNNETGVVAWKLELFTPERPRGYNVVVIANDITFQSGSFATPEDNVYSLASEYSRKHKLPRVNISSNSGARIGLAEEVAKVFRAKWRDPLKPEEGFDYLYVDGSEEQRLGDQIVYDKLPNGHLKLKAVVGKANENIGVENLQGSGLIAGETSTAYDEVPTYCFVTGRSVGIGAYTARLAHRIVQARTSHIILTGAPALNTLLGKEVYTSNNQLGGTQIMYRNGVTHAVVEDDFEGVCKIVQWMSYLPYKSENFPFVRGFGVDSGARDVVFPVQQNKAYNVRELIDSGNHPEHRGICDSGSFDEIMNDWAKTIVAGRARLRGLPIGVVSSELRNVMSVNPADPASPNSQSVEVHQAGQVWYPDSAFKTAEVINDFNREGLPLLFIASLRGFSGGQRDMFDMVLKFGAQIVDALRQYRQPVIIYIPTHGELRGGAWAVLDSKINPGFIHMVADKESRGGILEPSAIVGIKFRKEKFQAFQKKSDEILRQLEEQLTSEVKQFGSDSAEAANTRRLIEKRLEDIKNPYRAVAVELADLHDRPERMAIKNAVQHVTSLTESRTLFHSLFMAELAKGRLVEKYLEVAFRDTSRQEGYSWLSGKLDAFHEEVTRLPPAEQIPYLKQYFETIFDEDLRTVESERILATAERKLSRLSEEELRKMQEILRECARRRSFEL